MARTRSPYPSKSAVRRAVEQARAIGIDVGGIEVAPSGTIRVLDVRAISGAADADLFEQQMQKGLI